MARILKTMGFQFNHEISIFYLKSNAFYLSKQWLVSQKDGISIYL
jgi:hypothetical protein